MAAKAGDTIFSLESIVIDADGVCRAQLSVGIVGKDDARHPVRRQAVVVSLSAEQKVHLDALRAAVAAQVSASPPSDLADAVVVSAQTAKARTEERRARHFADRDARHNVQRQDHGSPPGSPGSGPGRGRRP